jgi:hypothetical protein
MNRGGKWSKKRDGFADCMTSILSLQASICERPRLYFEPLNLLWIPAFHSNANADPDQASKNNADPDPQPWLTVEHIPGREEYCVGRRAYFTVPR